MHTLYVCIICKLKMNILWLLLACPTMKFVILFAQIPKLKRMIKKWHSPLAIEVDQDTQTLKETSKA